MGFEPMTEHKLTLRVRWHRFWRKRRDKPPIPYPNPQVHDHSSGSQVALIAA
jgi:hypothetical protein